MLTGSHWRWLWFASALGIWAWGVMTGGGLSGLLLTWEVERFQSVDPGFSHFLLVIVLIVPPGTALVVYASRRPAMQPERLAFWSIVAGTLLWMPAGGAWLYALTLPDLRTAPLRIEIGQPPPATPVRNCNAILIGVPQPEYDFEYKEWTPGRGSHKFGHRVVPMTGYGWTPAQPVRFLMDDTGLYHDRWTRVNAGSGLPLAETGPGLLLKNAVPVYVRAALARKGVTLANDVMMHSTDPDTADMFWDVFAVLAGVAGFFWLVMGGALAIKYRHGAP